MSLDLLQRMRTADRLPSPPGVAIRILELVESEDASIEDLSEVICSDPALTAKILKYVNSPLMGMTFHGTTLLEAVSRIGMRGARMLALSFSLISQNHRESCPGFEFDQFWSESLARAVAARELAKAVGGRDADELFITALLCRIGKLVLATGMPAEYGPILGGETDGELPLEEREKKALGTDHLALGAEFLSDWQLPPSVTEVVAEFAAGRPTPAAALLVVADQVARFLVDESAQEAAEMSALEQLAQSRLELDADKLQELLRTISADWTSYGQLLSVPTTRAPDFDAIQREAEEQRTLLQLANEMEVQALRQENEQLSHLASRDGLTGLLNRGAFDSALPNAIQTAEGEQQAVALLMIDVDHFKAINDTHGHQVGDAVLKQVARILNDNARKRDEVFRYGGEEFAVIAPNCSRNGAETLAEGFRSAIEQETFEFEGTRIDVTASVGVGWAQWPAEPCEAGELLEYADQRLYDAKRGGRNRWCSEPPQAVGAGQRSGIFSRLGRLFAG